MANYLPLGSEVMILNQVPWPYVDNVVFSCSLLIFVGLQYRFMTYCYTVLSVVIII